MTTQIFVASTAYGLATVAAALDEGLFPAADRRLLLLTNNAAMPEVTAAVTDVAGVDTLLDRFDATIDYNDTIAPQHPSAWAPRSAELPLWERSLRALWGLGDDTVHLVLESIQASPALALARVFADARIDVYADGLMSYGPTRTALPDDVGWRIERLLHLDLVPGLVPMLLADWQVPPTVVSTDRFRAVIASMSPAHTEPQEQVVLVLGQYLAAADLLSETEEIRLYRELIVRAGRSTQRRVVFKPHPSAPLNQQAALRSAAAEAGVDLEITTELELAEAWFARGQVALVVGCFSTALLTAATLYRIPTARLGTELMLGRLSPFHNSNRIPVTIVDAVVPELTEPGAASTGTPPTTDLSALVVTVGYTMQPIGYAERRPDAVAFLTRYAASHARYFKRRRLTRLDLPGRLPVRPVHARARHLALVRAVWPGLRRARAGLAVKDKPR